MTTVTVTESNGSVHTFTFSATDLAYFIPSWESYPSDAVQYERDAIRAHDAYHGCSDHGCGGECNDYGCP